MIRRGHTAGFTMVELMVTVTVFSILFAVAFPPMSAWVNNNKMRAVADALQNGIRLAQAESLRRSRNVVFSLTNATNPVGAINAVANGNFWQVNVVPSLTDGSEALAKDAFVEAGVINTNARVIINGPAQVCFNSVGRLNARVATDVACPAPGAVTSYNISLTNPSADTRLFRVNVSVGGQVHMCDAARVYSNANPDGCP